LTWSNRGPISRWSIVGNLPRGAVSLSTLATLSRCRWSIFHNLPEARTPVTDRATRATGEVVDSAAQDAHLPPPDTYTIETPLRLENAGGGRASARAQPSPDDLQEWECKTGEFPGSNPRDRRARGGHDALQTKKPMTSRIPGCVVPVLHHHHPPGSRKERLAESSKRWRSRRPDSRSANIKLAHQPPTTSSRATKPASRSSATSDPSRPTAEVQGTRDAARARRSACRAAPTDRAPAPREATSSSSRPKESSGCGEAHSRTRSTSGGIFPCPRVPLAAPIITSRCRSWRLMNGSTAGCPTIASLSFVPPFCSKVSSIRLSAAVRCSMRSMKAMQTLQRDQRARQVNQSDPQRPARETMELLLATLASIPSAAPGRCCAKADPASSTRSTSLSANSGRLQNRRFSASTSCGVRAAFARAGCPASCVDSLWICNLATDSRSPNHLLPLVWRVTMLWPRNERRFGRPPAPAKVMLNHVRAVYSRSCS